MKKVLLAGLLIVATVSIVKAYKTHKDYAKDLSSIAYQKNVMGEGLSRFDKLTQGIC